MKRLFLLLALIPLLAAAQGLPRTELSAGLYRIHAEVADTFAARMQGLMHRESLGASDGMLFIFEQPNLECFWMKNTLIPLSIAFLDDDGSIVNIEDMKPQTEDSHCAKKPIRFALEMNAGWFATKGLREGARIRGLEKFKPAR